MQQNPCKIMVFGTSSTPDTTCMQHVMIENTSLLSTMKKDHPILLKTENFVNKV
jgi:hypothetical protein